MRRVVLIALLPLIACSQPSEGSNATAAAPVAGPGTSRIYDLAGFTGVALRGSDDVDVRVGSGFSVRAQGPAKQLDLLSITRDGDMLRVDRKPTNGLHWGDSGPVKVFVTMPRIVAADLIGSGNLAIDHVDGQRFRLGSRGSGDVAIGTLGVEAADLTLAGSGALHANGKVRHLSLTVAGSGDVEAEGLQADVATVSATGTGDVRAVVTGTAQVSATGTGDVDLGGQARCTTRKTGTGDVHCG
jgi:hypothetical protein